MHIKSWLPYIGIAVLALILGLVAGYFSLKQQPPGAIQSGPTNTLVLLRPGKPLPVFNLEGDNGKPFTRDSLTGHWSLLYFGYTHCPDVCPTTLADLTKMMAKLKDLPAAKQPQVVFVSVDPKRDTPARLREYVKYFDEDFSAATGPVAQLKILTKTLGIAFSYDPPDQSAGYAVSHSSAVLLIDPDGKETAVFTPPLMPEQMAENFRFVLKLQETAK